MGEFEKSRIEKALKDLSKENLCAILESTGLSVRECWDGDGDGNINKAAHSVILKKVSSRIDELSQEHWQKLAG